MNSFDTPTYPTFLFSRHSMLFLRQIFKMLTSFYFCLQWCGDHGLANVACWCSFWKSAYVLLSACSAAWSCCWNEQSSWALSVPTFWLLYWTSASSHRESKQLPWLFFFNSKTNVFFFLLTEPCATNSKESRTKGCCSREGRCCCWGSDGLSARREYQEVWSRG